MIRRATLADLEALTATRVALFAELGELPDGFATDAFTALCRTQLESMMTSGAASAWLGGPAGGPPCGAAVLLEYPRIPSPHNLLTREGYILNVYVAPAYRRRGIAGALIAAAVSEARQGGLGRVRLHTTTAARGVYRSHGFMPRHDEMELVL